MKSSVPCPVLRRRARRLEGLLQIGDAGKHRRQLLEMQLEGGGQQPRDGGLAGAGRSPQDDRMRPARRHHAARWDLRARADDPAPPLRPGVLGRSRSASGRGASSARPPDSKRSLIARLIAQTSREVLPAGLSRNLSPGCSRDLGRSRHFTPNRDRLLLVLPTWVRPPALTSWAF